MKLYILRWNPTFSMKYEEHLAAMKLLRKEHVTSNWSIYDHEELEEGDIFIFNQVGTDDEDGIAGIGHFTSEPYAAANWKEDDGTNRFYAGFEMDFMLDRRGGNIFGAEEMEKEFPQIDWHKGHAGVLAPSEITEKLLVYIICKLIIMKKATKKISYRYGFGEQVPTDVFARWINGLCPSLKEKIAQNGIEYHFFKEGEVIDKSLIEIAENRVYDIPLPDPCSEDDLARLFIAMA